MQMPHTVPSTGYRKLNPCAHRVGVGGRMTAGCNATSLLVVSLLSARSCSRFTTPPHTFPSSHTRPPERTFPRRPCRLVMSGWQNSPLA